MIKWLKFKYYTFVTTTYLIILAFIAFCGWYNHRIWETLGLFIAYLCLRYAYPKTFHCKKFLHCFLMTITVFAIVIPAVLPLSVSIFSSIFFGSLIGLGLCKLEEYQELKHIEFAKKTIFDLTTDEFYEVLNKANICDEEKRAVELRVVKHLKGKDWYNAMGYSKRNCQYLYKKGVEKLNKLL